MTYDKSTLTVEPTSRDRVLTPAFLLVLKQPVPRGYSARSPGNGQHMTDAEDRERESRLSEENKFVEQTEEVAEEQREKAARLANDPVVNETGDEE
jgi:hypothetical protein